jgi:transposase
VRREVWNDARKAGQPGLARELKGARFALWMNPERLTERHQQKIARVQQINKDPYRAYLICQQLRMIYRVPCQHALELLDKWLKWARRCRLTPFVKLSNTITTQRPGIEAALRNRLSNARTEQVNTQIRLITRRGFGYHSAWAVIALAMLSLGGLCPPLPGR